MDKEIRDKDLLIVGKLNFIKIDDIDVDQGLFDKLDENAYNLLKESILNFGLMYPVVVVKKEGGRYRLIDGRNRIRVLSEIGIDEVPAFLLNEEKVVNLDSFENVLQIDLELCRRHLKEDIYRMKEKEREEYIKYMKNNLRKKIFNLLKLEETEILRQNLDKFKLKEIYNIYESLKKVSKIPVAIEEISKQIKDKELNNNINNILNNEKIEDIKREIEKIYLSKIEESEKLVKKKDMELSEMRMQIEELRKSLEEKEKEYKKLIEYGKKIKSEIEKKIEEDYKRKVEELKEQYEKKMREALVTNLTSKEEYNKELEQLLSQYAEKFKFEKMELIRKHNEELALLRKQVDEIRQELFQKQKLFEAMALEKKRLEEERKILFAERNRYEAKIKELVNNFSKITNIKTIFELMQVLKTSLESINNLILQSFLPVDEIQKNKVKGMWNDLREFFYEVDQVVSDWIDSLENEKGEKQEMEAKVVGEDG